MKNQTEFGSKLALPILRQESTNPVLWLPWKLNIVRSPLIFGGPQYGNYLNFFLNSSYNTIFNNFSTAFTLTRTQKTSKPQTEYNKTKRYFYINFNMNCRVCAISQIQYTCILFTVLNIMYLMPEAGHYVRNMQHVLIRLINMIK